MNTNADNRIDNSLIRFVSELLIRECDCLYQIDLGSNTYTARKSSPFMDSVLPEAGDYFTFCKTLFYQKTYAASYDSFVRLNIPKEKTFLRQIRIESEGRIYNMIFLFIPDHKGETALVFIFSNQDYSVPATLESSQQTALEDGLLYSMMVNLDKDTCYDIKVNELKQSSQPNDITMSFEEWRNIITKSILSEFQSLFLEKTTFSYITRNLLSGTRYWFDVQLHNLSNEIVWARHCIIRIKEGDDNDLRFLYIVQNINVEKEKQLNYLYKMGNIHQNHSDPSELTSDHAADNGRFSTLSLIVLSQVEAELREHYMENLSLNQIAAKYYINCAYLGQLFIRKYGMTFHKYLNKQRMEAAAKLLITTNRPINEIAENVGIPNSNYFNRLFHAYYGCTPLKYRNRK